MQIRRSTPLDAPAIARLEALAFSDPWSAEDISSIIVKEGALSYTALSDEGEILAYVIGVVIPPEGEIYRIATLPAARRRGIAYRLLDYAIKTERGRGLESLFLEVRSQNSPARALYKAYGFREVGVRKGYYKNPDDDAVVMLLSHGTNNYEG